MPNDLSIAPLDFDTWPAARCDAFPEDALLSVSFDAVKRAEVWRLKKSFIQNWKELPCKVKEIGRKTD